VSGQATSLKFEKSIQQLEEKITELQRLSEDNVVDLTTELAALTQKLSAIKTETYQNLSPWHITQIARHTDRPLSLDYLTTIFEDFVELHGGRQFPDDKAIVGGLARFRGRPVVVIGHQKGKDTNDNIYRNFGMPHPEGYRKALRIMNLGNKFNRPIITFIDTPGAFPGLEAEQRGQAEAIARNIFEMSFFQVPVVVTIIGEGGSGGAVAIGVGDRVLMLENSIYSVISPEGCASILWKDASRAEDAASALKLTSGDLLKLGVVDEVIPEPLGGAHKDYSATTAAVATAIDKHLTELSQLAPADLVRLRQEKYREMGVFRED